MSSTPTHWKSIKLSQPELIRYQRHFVLGSVGQMGQKKLKAAKVLIVGLGGLGTPVAQYLTAAGIGVLGLMEFDEIALSNLQRQVLYSTKQVGEKKLAVAMQALSKLNPEVKLIPHACKAEQGAEAILKNYDLIIDATDNFPARYWLNDCCHSLNKPNVHGSVYQFEGQVSVFDSQNSPCYRCLFPQAVGTQNCSEAGVMGAVVGVIGSLQANEAIKWLLSIGCHAVGKLLVFNALNLQWHEFKFSKDPNCLTCGAGAGAKPRPNPSINAVTSKHAPKGSDQQNNWEIEPLELKTWQTNKVDYQLLDVREEYEYQITHLDGLWVPLGELNLRLRELKPCKNRKLVVVCQHGTRSAKAVQVLFNEGFKTVYSLKGGLDQYSLQVDPSITRY